MKEELPSHNVLLPEIAAAWTPAPGDLQMQQRFGLQARYTRSPLFRHLQRALFQPKLRLFRNRSALSGQPLLSMYPPDNGFPIYSVEEWWSDCWDASTYGCAYDFNRPFFEQYAKLYCTVPKQNVFNERTENCEYSLSAGFSKNCYYCNRVYRSHDLYYCELCNKNCENLCDCLIVNESSWLYDCMLCNNCHQSVSLFQCENSRDCYYCIDCQGCSDCIFCSNLRRKSYCFRNKQVSREEFERLKAGCIDNRHSTREGCLTEFRELWDKSVWPATALLNCEDCTGDMLRNCARCFECYNCVRLSDARYCWDYIPSKSATFCMDCTGGGNSELVVNSSSLGAGCYMMRMCIKCRGSSNLTYCTDCADCSDCFGCTGMVHRQYCVMNKQYTAAEYQKLVERIITHMQHTGEWGHFFPPSMSPFGYNGSIASSYIALQQKEAEAFGFPWKQEPPQQTLNQAAAAVLSDELTPSFESGGGQALRCESSGNAYKITAAELAFYHQMHLPLPRLCPNERAARRRRLLRPRHSWSRQCAKTGAAIETAFPPGSPEVVYSRQAYTDSLY